MKVEIDKLREELAAVIAERDEALQKLATSENSVARRGAMIEALQEERGEVRRELNNFLSYGQGGANVADSQLLAQLAERDAEIEASKKDYQVLLDDAVFMRQQCAQHVQKIAELSGRFGGTETPKQLRPNMTNALPRGVPDPLPEGDWD